LDRFKAEGKQINMEVIFKFPDKSTFFCCSVNKGNNKITEHRAIFQRESQNS